MVTQELLHRLFHYNQATGVFTYKVSTARRIKVGNIAGTLTKRGYINIQVQRKQYKAHRLAWLYMTGTFPTELIDHINGVGSDNKFCNLREASNGQNQQNSRLVSSSRIPIKGITYREASGSRKPIYVACVKCLGVVYTKAISVIPPITDEEVIEELSTWLKATRESLHKEFTNHGEYDEVH